MDIPSKAGHGYFPFPSDQAMSDTHSSNMSCSSWPDSFGCATTPEMSESPPAFNPSEAGRKIDINAVMSSLNIQKEACPQEDKIQPRYKIDRICFVGAGFVGGPTAAVVAYHNPHITVNVVDLNTDRINAWNSAHLPIHEASLDKIVRITRDGTRSVNVSLPKISSVVQIPPRPPNLFFSTDVETSVAAADIIFICVNTPTKTFGVGAGASADLSALEAATIMIAKKAKPGAIIVEKSTVPCGTAHMISTILRHYRPHEHFEVLNNPEFLAEGTAVADLMYPGRVLIGSSGTAEGLQAAEALKSVYAAWVPRERLLGAQTFSSELTKLVANAMLAQRISSMNAVSAMCEELGPGDVNEVARALGADARLGHRFLQAGIGFGGSCFDKDIRNLAYLARSLHLDVVADYWTAILNVNKYQHERFSRAVVRRLNGSLRGKKLAVLGFAFKSGTNDTRNSVAVHVIVQLARELPNQITVFDPGCAVVDIEEEIDQHITDQKQRSRVNVVSTWREAVVGASAVCILTPWGQFGTVRSESGKKNCVPLVCAPTLSSSSSHIPWKKSLNEMEILQVEDLARQHGIADQRGGYDDPLGRLAPEFSCKTDCTHCKASATTKDTSSVDWKIVAEEMGEHSWVFDGRNSIDVDYLESLGLNVHVIGRGV